MISEHNQTVFKGVWIPAEIWETDKLTWMQKIVWAAGFLFLIFKIKLLRWITLVQEEVLRMLVVQNVFTITGYSGIDPTASITGIDNNIYPRTRTFTGGLSVGF